MGGILCAYSWGSWAPTPQLRLILYVSPSHWLLSPACFLHFHPAPEDISRKEGTGHCPGRGHLSGQSRVWQACLSLSQSSAGPRLAPSLLMPTSEVTPMSWRQGWPSPVPSGSENVLLEGQCGSKWHLSPLGFGLILPKERIKHPSTECRASARQEEFTAALQLTLCRGRALLP